MEVYRAKIKTIFCCLFFFFIRLGIKASSASSNNPTEQVVEFLEDNCEIIEAEIEDGIQNNLFSEQIVDNISRIRKLIKIGLVVCKKQIF